jgi:hypothetical protein
MRTDRALVVVLALPALACSGGPGEASSSSPGSCSYVSYNVTTCIEGMTASAYADAKTNAARQTAGCPTCQASRQSCTDGARCPNDPTFLGKCQAPSGTVTFQYVGDPIPGQSSSVDREDATVDLPDHCTRVVKGVWSTTF